MTGDLIERYDKCITNGCPYDLIFGYSNHQPIPSKYYNLLNDDDGDVNNIPGTPIDYALPDNERVEDSVMPNYEEINDEKIIDDDYSLASEIDPSKIKFYKLKDWKMKKVEGKLKEWTQKMKEWTIHSYLLIENDITKEILPSSATTMEDSIGYPCDGAT